jgi:glycerol kinase
MEQDSRAKVPFICCSGGPAKNNYLMQFLADVMDSTVLVPSNEEMTCLGAAILAGKALGIMDLSVIERAYTRRKYTSAMNADVRREKQQRWNLAVKQTLCR